MRVSTAKIKVSRFVYFDYLWFFQILKDKEEILAAAAGELRSNQFFFFLEKQYWV